jgi:hypothetical protein
MWHREQDIHLPNQMEHVVQQAWGIQMKVLKINDNVSLE